MSDFIWIDYNRQKVANHSLSEDEVEFAWRRRVDLTRGVHPDHGPYWTSAGKCPSGRRIKIVWRSGTDRDGEETVYVITAHNL